MRARTFCCRAGAPARRLPLSLLAALGLAIAGSAPAAAISVGVELLVATNGFCQPEGCSAIGAADEASNTPLDLFVQVGDEIEVAVLISFGLPLREYQTDVTLNAAELGFSSAIDISTLGFSSLADPNDTLADASPGAGAADSNLCAPIVCTAPSSNHLYSLFFTVLPGFTPDALRDLTVSVASMQFGRAEDSLDPARDTASLRLQLIPEPGTGLLLALGLLGLGLRRAAR